jgi:protein-tyrosine-phosphatase
MAPDGNRSKHVDEFSGESFDYVLTVCSSANVELPRVSGTHESFASQL